jgi:hypothetical protein
MCGNKHASDRSSSSSYRRPLVAIALVAVLASLAFVFAVPGCGLGR